MPRFYGWKLVAALWAILAINLAFPIYGASVINAYMAEEMSIDRATLGLLFSVYMLMSGIPGPLVAAYLNRVGVRATLISGSLILHVGCLLMATVVDTPSLAVLVFGVVIGAGVVTGSLLPAQTGITYWFVHRRALALAIILSGPSIGGFIAPPLLDRMIVATAEWRTGWWFIALLTGLSALLAALFVRNKPEDLGQLPDGTAQTINENSLKKEHRIFITSEEWTVSEAIRSTTFWLLLLCGAILSAGFSLFMAHGVVHLKDIGHTPVLAAISISIMVFANLPGKLIIGTLGGYIEPRYLWAATMGIFSVGMVLAIDATRNIDIYLFSCLLGFGFGGGVVCMMTIFSNYFGARVYATLIGLLMAVQTAVSAAAPVAAGYAFDYFGSYVTAFFSAALLATAAALLLLFLRAPERKQAILLKQENSGDYQVDYQDE